MMNNWHIKIADCTEAQKEVLKRVYGTEILRYDYYGRDKNSIAAYNFDVGELITPDEAFELLGLGEDTKALTKCENSIVKAKKQLTRRTAKLREAEQKIGELESQKIALLQSNALIEDELAHAKKINYKLEHAIGCRKEDLFNAEQKIKELEQGKATLAELFDRLAEQSKKDTFKYTSRIQELEKQLGSVTQEAKNNACELDTQREIIQDIRDLFDIRVHDFNLIGAVKIRLAEMKQQLAAKSELQGIDWSNVAQDLVYLAQKKDDHGAFGLFSHADWAVYQDRYNLIATRPKPKYTSDELKIAEKVWLAFFEDDESNQTLFHEWLKEVSDETK